MAERGFGDVMENAVAAIASMAGDLFPESGSKMERMVMQGAAELSAALFGESNAYVAYGEGQKAVEVEAPQVEQERGGMEM